MKSAILSIGNEVVEGFVTNFNATYFATKLNEIGIHVEKHLTVLDKQKDIEDAIHYLNKDYDLIIISGGLGPTGDDITKESIASALNLELTLDVAQQTRLKEWFASRNREYLSTNDKQVYFTSIDNILINNRGTANAYWFELDGTKYCVLPGPPSENKILMDEFVLTLSKNKVYEKDLYLINVGESTSEKMMEHLYEKYPDVYIGCYMQDWGLNYRLKSTNQNQMDACLQELQTIFKDFYLCDSSNPVEHIVRYFIENNLTISFVESCTAGLACASIGNISGVSSILNESYITYSNQAKHNVMNVSWDTLNNFGAVSQECANELSNNLFKKTNSKICISITGIAGPDGGSLEKPVGLVYFALTYNNKTYEFNEIFGGTRDLVRNRAFKFILFESYKVIKNV